MFIIGYLKNNIAYKINMLVATRGSKGPLDSTGQSKKTKIKTAKLVETRGSKGPLDSTGQSKKTKIKTAKLVETRGSKGPLDSTHLGANKWNQKQITNMLILPRYL